MEILIGVFRKGKHRFTPEQIAVLVSSNGDKKTLVAGFNKKFGLSLPESLIVAAARLAKKKQRAARRKQAKAPREITAQHQQTSQTPMSIAKHCFRAGHPLSGKKT